MLLPSINNKDPEQFGRRRQGRHLLKQFRKRLDAFTVSYGSLLAASNLRIMYVSSDELRLETSIICRRGFLSQTTQIFYDFKLLFCRRQRRNVNTLKTQVLHIRSFFFATSSLPPLSWFAKGPYNVTHKAMTQSFSYHCCF